MPGGVAVAGAAEAVAPPPSCLLLFWPSPFWPAAAAVDAVFESLCNAESDAACDVAAPALAAVPALAADAFAEAGIVVVGCDGSDCALALALLALGAPMGLAAVSVWSFVVWRRAAKPAPEDGCIPGALAEETATETAAISMVPGLCTVVDDPSVKSRLGRKQTTGQS